MKFSWTLKLALWGIGAWGGGKALLADVQYTITTVAFPGASTMARGINDIGQIVGQYSGPTGLNGYLYSGGSFTTFDVPGATQTLLTGINDSGEIVGRYSTATGAEEAFLYSDGTFTTINFPGAAYTEPLGINNAGQIVGWLNESTGFLYSGGAFSMFQYPGTNNLAGVTSANGINDSGQIVGNFSGAMALPSIGCFFYSGGSFTTIAGVTCQANGINDKGQVVGDNPTPFLWSNGAFIPTNLPNSAFPSGINNSGQVVGTYVVNGNVEGFLATPTVPEPRTLPVLTASLLALFVITWRRKRALRL